MYVKVKNYGHHNTPIRMANFFGRVIYLFEKESTPVHRGEGQRDRES